MFRSSAPASLNLITEQQYAQIAAACDRLLRARDTSLARLAIPSLHVINEHPGCLAQYRQLQDTAYGRPRFAAAHCIKDAARIARGLTRSLRWRDEYLNQVHSLGRVDVMIVSHIGNRTLLEQDDDFYFGSMQQLLHERGVTSVLVLVNHLYTEDPGLAGVMRPHPAARLLLPRSAAAGVETNIWRQCIAARRQLDQAALRADNPLDGAVARLASDQALSAGTAANLRLHACLTGICALLSPRILITTHEGDGSERMIWHAARRDGRRPLCVGYQHTRLLQHAHAIRRPVNAPGIDCDPDIILTLGEISHDMLAAAPDLEGVRLIRYGSHRRAASTDTAHSGERPRLCVVLPDNDDHECAILFEFALACARRAPEISFVLRPHPATSLATLLSRHGFLRNLPDNVILSTKDTMETDSARARYCLYRGSSAAIHAVLAGVKPFYLARTNELACDPLYALSEWRETVASPEELLQRMRAADHAPDLDAAARARNFCDRHVACVRSAALDELLGLA